MRLRFAEHFVDATFIYGRSAGGINLTRVNLPPIGGHQDTLDLHHFRPLSAPVLWGRRYATIVRLSEANRMLDTNKCGYSSLTSAFRRFYCMRVADVDGAR